MSSHVCVCACVCVWVCMTRAHTIRVYWVGFSRRRVNRQACTKSRNLYVCRQTFSHLHALDMQFQLERNTGVCCVSDICFHPLFLILTGALSRSIDRGTRCSHAHFGVFLFGLSCVPLHFRSINFILNSLPFNVVPTIFEITLVCFVLV